MLNLSTERLRDRKSTELQRQKVRSLEGYHLDKIRDWTNGLMEDEKDQLLGRGRYVMLDERRDRYFASYWPRRANLFGLVLGDANRRHIYSIELESLNPR